MYQLKIVKENTEPVIADLTEAFLAGLPDGDEADFYGLLLDFMNCIAEMPWMPRGRTICLENKQVSIDDRKVNAEFSLFLYDQLPLTLLPVFTVLWQALPTILADSPFTYQAEMTENRIFVQLAVENVNVEGIRICLDGTGVSVTYIDSDAEDDENLCDGLSPIDSLPAIHAAVRAVIKCTAEYKYYCLRREQRKIRDELAEQMIAHGAPHFIKRFRLSAVVAQFIAPPKCWPVKRRLRRR